jgi:hypothetical protein
MGSRIWKEKMGWDLCFLVQWQNWVDFEMGFGILFLAITRESKNHLLKQKKKKKKGKILSLDPKRGIERKL